MSQNVTFLGDLADWLDGAATRYLEVRDAVVGWADAHTYGLAHRWNPVSYAAVALNSVGVHLVQSFVDTLRLGNGVRDGGWGYARDGLRLLNVIGGAGAIVGRVARTLAVTQAPGTYTCSWITHVNVLRRTGQKFFMSVRDLMRPIGTSETFVNRAGGTHAELYRDMLAVIRRLVPGLREFRPTSPTRSLQEVVNLAQSNRRGVFTLSFEYEESLADFGHTLFGTYSREAGMVFTDTNGRVFYGLNALLAEYRGAMLARNFPITFIPDSALITVARAAEASGLPALFGDVVLSVLPVVVSTRDAPLPDGERMSPALGPQSGLSGPPRGTLNRLHRRGVGRQLA
jgi:hypothetical protein